VRFCAKNSTTTGLVCCLFVFLFIVLGGGLRLNPGGAFLGAATGTPGHRLRVYAAVRAGAKQGELIGLTDSVELSARTEPWEGDGVASRHFRRLCSESLCFWKSNPRPGYNYGRMHAAEFTPAEASWVTGLSVKVVNKVVEDAGVPFRTTRDGKRRRRYLPYSSLVCLQLHGQGLNRLPLRVRKDVFRRVLRQPHRKQLKYTEALIIDVDAARAKITTRLEELERATRVIESDPEILQGTPVFRGTRIPVYLIADVVERGVSREEILDGYPSLTREMIDHARVFAATQPKRGRPVTQPWSGKKPLRHNKSKLARVA
jgi:uncharacterized protein (DUF433 family)